MDVHAKYGLRRVINAYDKATLLGGARVPAEIADVVSAGLGEAFEIDDMQRVAGEAIVAATGAEWGGVTSCAAAGITLGAAACMTGTDPARIAQLPDTTRMPNRVLIQAGHAISFGAPVTQMIRLAGAQVAEVGSAEGCRPRQLEEELSRGDVAAVVCVESYHTADYPGLSISEVVSAAHRVRVPVVVDAATQELRLPEIVAMGPDLVVCSARKYLRSTTAGVVAGRRDLVEAVLRQSAGIGRTMKVGKEGILGAVAAFETASWRDRAAWSRRETQKISHILDRLSGLDGVSATVSPDPNGCPFDRVCLRLDPVATGHTPDSLRSALLEGDPAVHVRVYRPDNGCIFLNATEMDPAEVDVLCDRIVRVLRRGNS